jgi:hypothetical protein
MKTELISLARVSATLINQNLQGKKRWLSLCAFGLLIAATLAGFPLDDLVRQMALDPNWEKDTTIAALMAAGGVTFRFFQQVGTNRDVREQVDRVAELERKTRRMR